MRSRFPILHLLILAGIPAELNIASSAIESLDRPKAEYAENHARGTGDAIAITVDASAPGKPLRHVWQYFGYDECNYTTTPHAWELMTSLADSNPEPVYLRQHFLLASGDGKPSLKWGSSNAYTEDAAGNPVYDWRIMDQIMDAVIGSGCRPLVEIGFMPKALSIKPEPYKSQDPFSRYRCHLRPQAGGLVVSRQAVVLVAGENRRPQAVRGDAPILCKKLPGPLDCLGLEVIIERPVTQHLEKSMVIGVFAHFLEVIVLSAYTQAFLAVDSTAILRGHQPQKNVLKLVHPRIGEK